MIKACIFDLDGTLLDTLTTITYYVNRTISRYGIDEITVEECRGFVGSGARKLLSRVLDSRGINDAALFDRIFREYNAAYDAKPYHLTLPYEGITELLDWLTERGIALAVLSNKPDFATREAIAHFFGSRFSLVRGGIDGVPLKPAPDAAFDILHSLGVTADEAAYIGDSDVDVITARNLGAALPITVLWGFRTREELSAVGAQNLVSHPREIISLIESETT